MGVLETKVKVHNASGISKKINRRWNWLFNYDHHYNGRVWVGWDPGVWKVSLHSSNAQCITCVATFLEKDITILVSFVYAYNEACDRVSLWNYCTNLTNSSLPWCLLGDFNCVLGIDEISGGGEYWATGNAFVKARGLMDHNPILYEKPMQLAKFGKPFQFFNFMIDVPGFIDLISRTWARGCNGNPITQFNFKLKNVKSDLRDFNKEHENLHNLVNFVRAQLNEVQEALISDNSPSLVQQELLLIEKLNTTIIQEEHLLLQKSRVKWMQKGDGNNSFFRQQCKVNWNHSKVLSLHNVEDPIDLDLVDCNTINGDQARLLVAHVTYLIIFETLKIIKRNKAPGPDGVNVEFFLATWEITGSCFCEAVKHFFLTSTMSIGTHATFLSLISKIIASGLKKVLPNIVNNAHSAFIPGRSISDNILLAQELFRGHDRETGASRCALKIDLHKAFDTIHWNFILAVLNKIQDPGRDDFLDQELWFNDTYSIPGGPFPVPKLLGILYAYQRRREVFYIPVFYHSWVEFLVSLTELEDKQKGTIALCYAQVYCYHIWRERNVMEHDKGVFGPLKLLQGIVLDVEAKLSASGWYSSVICNRPDLDNFVRL
ncbi:uncharacterized protein LOC141664844 [Apium graveolens]|uniref:uncharacterized protein LOC141664844 n=1 Tax=Apium graveolens TaxID=4045 RepID=UPI003D795943